MSVINKVLQDLDQRQALGAGADATLVRAPAAKPHSREWFWRVLAALIIVCVGWVAWVAIQLMPRNSVVTDAAFRAADEARTRTRIQAPKPSAPVATPAAPAPAAPVAPAASPAFSESLKMAEELQTPVREPAPPKVEAASIEAPKSEAPRPAKTEPLKPVATKPEVQVPAKGTVDRRERSRSAGEVAENHFRRAAVLLNHGRVSEAEEQLVAALHADPLHTGARQAYVAMLLEQQRFDAARRVLQDALAANPGQPMFALALARLHAEQREYFAALEVMDKAGSVSRNADFQALRAAVLQRLNRHAEAVDAYQAAIKGAAQPATTWVGLGISLEAVGRKSEAAQAYRRALGSGPLAPEAREYAENRARALE